MLPFLLGCAPVTIEQPALPSDTTPDTGSSGAEPVDTGPESIEGGGTGSDWIYNERTVHTLDISITPENIDILNEGSEAYSAAVVWVEVDITYDGVPLSDVGLRLKGRWGSWRSFDDKPSLKIDFNRYIDGQELEGLEALTLNNMIIDCSFMREHMAYPVYEAMGVPVPRTAYVRVTVNGEDYGLYLNIESIDDAYLDRHYEDGGGNLYDADYILWESGGYTVLDFYASLVGYFEQEEGEDVGGADLLQIAELLETHGGTPDFYTATAEHIDWDHHLRMVAAEMWVGQNDGYSLNRNNYLVYFPPKGRMVIQPWDHDYAFLSASDWGFSWTNPTGLLTSLCVADAACRADLVARVEDVLTAVEALDYDERFDDTRSLIAPHIAADTRRECTDAYVGWYQAELESWPRSRDDELRSIWGL